MKKLLLSSVALAGLTVGAMAADLPSRRVAPAPFVAVPVFTWTGFYIGVNAGYGFSDSNRNNFGQFGAPGNLTAFGPGAIATAVTPAGGGFGTLNGGRNDRDGFIGGGQIGYNYQIGSFVVGLEADFQYADFGGGRNNGGLSGFGANGFGTAVPTANIGLVQPGAPGNVAFFGNAIGNDPARIDFFGTVRGRLGYAIDRVMIFATGGLAYNDGGRRGSSFGFGGGTGVPGPFFTTAAAQNSGNAVSSAGFRRNRLDEIGYAVGGGVEYAFTPNITAKVEGLYVNFGGRGSNTGGVVGVTNTGAPIVNNFGRSNRGDLDFAVVRAGVNYKFNLF